MVSTLWVTGESPFLILVSLWCKIGMHILTISKSCTDWSIQWADVDCTPYQSIAKLIKWKLANNITAHLSVLMIRNVQSFALYSLFRANQWLNIYYYDWKDIDNEECKMENSWKFATTFHVLLLPIGQLTLKTLLQAIVQSYYITISITCVLLLQELF